MERRESREATEEEGFALITTWEEKELKLYENQKICVSPRNSYPFSLIAWSFLWRLITVTSRQKRFSNFRRYISAQQINTLVFP